MTVEIGTISIFYEIPIFIIILLLFFFISQNIVTKRKVTEENIRKVNYWLIASGISFIVWAVDHIYSDLFPLDKKTMLFFHYIVSHGFLLVTVIFLAIASKYIGNFGQLYGFKTKKFFNEKK